MDHSTPGFLLLHYLPEFAQTHVHSVGDAIQPSHSLSPPSPLTLNLFEHQGLFQKSVLRIRWPKYWSFSYTISPSNKYSGLISFRIDWLDLLAVQGTRKTYSSTSLKTLKTYSSTTVRKHQFFSVQPSLIHFILRRNVFSLCVYGV